MRAERIVLVVAGQKKKTTASFDVFDTVLTRRVGDPRALFLLLGRRLAGKGLIDCTPQAFSLARAEAERRSFRNAGGLDSNTSLDDIHRDLAAAIHIPAGQIDKLISEELELESDLLVPVPDGVRRINAARRRGEQIIFVSDMYVGRDFLLDQLRRHSLFHHGDRLFLSNEIASSKATGAIWKTVLDELDAQPSDIHHTGNDRRSDDRSARKAGLASTLVAENNLNRYEETLEQHSFSTDGLTSTLAGASRLARLDDETTGPRHRALRSVAAGVVAPFVIGKVLWMLEHAKAEGLEAIYFVARDGQVLRDVALELAPKVGYQGELNYLFGSRQAWALPSMTGDWDGIIETLCPDIGDLDASLRTILHRFALDPDEITGDLEDVGFTKQSFDMQLDQTARRRVRLLLRTEPTLAQLIYDRSSDARNLMLRYLEQEGILTNRPIGLVDLGTGATLFNSLSAVLDTVGIQPPVSFYFGLRDDVTDKGFGFPRAYVRDETARVGYLHTPGLLTLVEMACTADHGSVTGYTLSGERVEPTFAASGNQPVVDWGLAVVRETIRRVAAELMLDPDLVSHRQVDLRPAILDVFELFWTAPTAGEAATWGAYPFEDGWGDDSIRHPIAHRQGPTAVLRRQPHRHWWEAGAQQLSGPVSRILLRSRAGSINSLRALQQRLP